ncbi:MAG: hypothetical protein ACR2H5_06330 [Ktedonobacteraceae bacterium]
MNKIRCFFAAIALLATLGGFSVQGMGSIANAASSQHASAVSSQLAAGQLAARPYWPCPAPGSDC